MPLAWIASVGFERAHAHDARGDLKPPRCGPHQNGDRHGSGPSPKAAITARSDVPSVGGRTAFFEPPTDRVVCYMRLSTRPSRGRRGGRRRGARPERRSSFGVTERADHAPWPLPRPVRRHGDRADPARPAAWKGLKGLSSSRTNEGPPSRPRGRPSPRGRG